MSARHLVSIFIGALTACGGPQAGKASIDASDITPVASAGTTFVAEKNQRSGQAMGRFDVVLSVAASGSACDKLGSLPSDGALGILELWSPTTSTDLAAGSYPIIPDATVGIEDGGVTAQLSVTDLTNQVEYLAESGTVTLSAGAAGHLVGSFQASCSHQDSHPGQQVDDTRTLTGTFDSPLCKESSALR